MQIFMDESGFTGEDLASKEQPLFVLSSCIAEDAFCEQIRRDIFSGVRSRELKHSALARTSVGRRIVVEFLKAIQGTGAFSSWIVHKEFCLLTKFVDFWLEPAMKISGIDLYERGTNLAFSNMAYICLRTFESPEFLSDHLKAFQTMVRRRTPASYIEFWGGLGHAYNNCRKESKEILDFFFSSEEVLGPDILTSLPERSLEAVAQPWTRH
jgi:hypothetical protein